MKKLKNIVALMGTIVLLIAGPINTNAQEIKIGTQTWSAKNLDVSTFRNGDVIPEVKNNDEWQKAGAEGKPAWCYYENDAANGKKYGKLYNFFAVSDPRGIAPAGWHVPTYDEWKTLNDYLGGADNAGPKLKSTSGWSSNGNGNNESGFNAMPAGSRPYGDGSFWGLGEVCYFWTATEDYESDSHESAWYHLLNLTGSSYRDLLNKTYGFPVRCVKD